MGSKIRKLFAPMKGMRFLFALPSVSVRRPASENPEAPTIAIAGMNVKLLVIIDPGERPTRLFITAGEACSYC